jgi:excinuclease ABC subunit C
MERVVSIDTIISQNGFEALLLEFALIKQWKPRFNINLKDGKTYPVIRITREEYPRVFRTRWIVFDGSQYYGPFPNAGLLDRYLTLIEKVFPLRKCKGALKPRSHPCLYYHMNRCSAPCAGYIDRGEYLKIVDKIRKLLTGETEELIEELTGKMNKASDARAYEKAAAYRDQINAIREFAEGLHVMDRKDVARDYLGYAFEDNLCSFVILQTRGGSLAGKELYQTEMYSDPTDTLQEFVLQYYDKSARPPSTLYVSRSADNRRLSEYLTRTLDRPITIRTPRSAHNRKMIAMAEENAREDILDRTRNRDDLEALRQLQDALGIDRLPMRIEGFDVAHLSGKDTVASMVSFFNGKSEKSLYRHFKIRSLKGRIDDFEALRETTARRYSRVLNEDLDRPDLILVDGGKGQVGAVQSVLNSLGMENTPLIGLAKEREEIFFPTRRQSLVLEEGSVALRILQAIRDESHRFATTYHKKLRDKKVGTSILEDVKGIGPKKSRKLLSEFGSLEAIMASSIEDLKGKAGLSDTEAGALVEYLKAHTAATESALQMAEGL